VGENILSEDFDMSFVNDTNKDDISGIKLKADFGDADAMLKLGYMYFHGRDDGIITRDSQEAIKWFTRAATKGKENARLRLVYIYATGTDGIPTNDAEAIKWYRAIAPRVSELDAIKEIAETFGDGNFVVRDYEYDPWRPEEFRAKENAQRQAKKRTPLKFAFDAEGFDPYADVDNAIKWYKKAAEQGDLASQKKLAAGYNRLHHSSSYMHGDAKKEAISWFRKVAEQGDAWAQLRLATQLLVGEDVEHDDVEAVMWLIKAAEKSHPIAQWASGQMYAEGRGVIRDDTQAAKWFKAAAEQGQRLGQYGFGVMLAEGRGIAQDDAQAVKWFQLSVQQGYSAADAKLAVMYEKGRGVSKNPEEAEKRYNKTAKEGNDEALEWYRKAAERGDHQAEVVFVNAAVNQNPKAIAFTRKIAEKGDSTAQTILGMMYYSNCFRGDGQDFATHEVEAEKWLKKGAEKGAPIAQASIAWMYEYGTGGLEKDAVQAREWREKAAKQEHPLAQLHLARMYANGIGGAKQDQAEVLKLLNQVAQQQEDQSSRERATISLNAINRGDQDRLANILESALSTGSNNLAARLRCGEGALWANPPDIGAYLRSMYILSE
jgi:TPR repeat protein